MKPMNPSSPVRTFGVRGRRLSRRTFLRGAGVALALPALECMMPAATVGNAGSAEPRRMLAINFELSFYPPNMIPEQAGRDYELPRYLQPLEDLRRDFTFVSGSSHPEVDGGHAAAVSWLTGAPHPGAANFRNSISIDQLAARQIGLQTRFSYMALGSGLSISDSGVRLPGHHRASRHFADMFLEGRPDEKARQIERLREGRSVLDTVRDAANRMRNRVSRLDRDKLDEYFTAVRAAEQQLQKSEQWQHQPKPKIEAQPPRDILDQNDIINRARQLYDIMYLALVSDSTRLITYTVGDSNSVASLPGISMNYHDLSHHGKEPEKLRQLALIESEHVKAFGDFLRRLKSTGEGDSHLLERTMVLFGSHMHSGGHDNRNLPIILAGGGFGHGQHLRFDRENNTPLANLYVTMLQRLGLEVERFASSTGTLTGLEVRG